MSYGSYGTPQVPSFKRAWYSSVVAVTRLGEEPGATTTITDGAPTYDWVTSTDLIDVYWAVPGQMQCRIDCQFIRPGSTAPMPAEIATKIPRVGTVYYDIPTDPQFVRAGDTLVAIEGPFKGASFEIRVIPEPAQGFLGSSHMEAQIVEVAILPGQFPGVDPGSGYGG